MISIKITNANASIIGPDDAYLILSETPIGGTFPVQSASVGSWSINKAPDAPGSPSVVNRFFGSDVRSGVVLSSLQVSGSGQGRLYFSGYPGYNPINEAIIGDVISFSITFHR